MKFLKLGLATKLYGVFALMALSTLALAGILAVTTDQRARLSAEYDSAALGAHAVEKINGLIYAVVMESRGVYMSPDTKAAKPYADGILKLNKSIEAEVQAWKKRVREDDAQAFETFEKRIGQFVKFRHELARLGTDVSPAAGREWGDNDANRSVRKALNSDLEALAKVYSERVSRIYADIEELNARNRLYMWSAIGICLLVAAFGVLTIAFGIVRPLDRLAKIMHRVAADETNIEIPDRLRRDEIGNMAQSVVVFRDAAVLRHKLEAEAEAQRQAVAEQQRLSAEQQQKVAAMEAQVAEERAQTAAQQAATAEEQAQRTHEQAQEQRHVIETLSNALTHLAAGDLTLRIGNDVTGGYAPLRDGYNNSIDGLAETLKAVVEGLKEIGIAAEEIAMSTTDLSQRTEEQSASLEETTASMQQIMEAVHKNVEQARRATQLASSACDVASRGEKVATDAVEAMSRIDASSKEITKIVSVIDEIARQTNLLALNAAVEAARAGDAGRGFAVVASEVRNLAIRSSSAAKEISELIAKSDMQVKNGVEMVNTAGTSLHEINGWVKQVSDIVTAIDSASGQQAGSIDEINTALAQMDEVTQKNSALVEQNAAATKTLEHQCLTMNQRIAMFKLGPDAKHQTQAYEEPQQKRYAIA